VAYPPAKPAAQRGRQGFRLPLLPVLALLIALSVLTDAPLWVLIFPLMFFARGRRGCAPAYGHGDYRRPRRHHGW
jgi:hypothetical protein